jgi:group II intron reverse transcriptase/maturase
VRLPALGIYTRLTGLALNGSAIWCTLSASLALASGVSTTSPSTPAVRRPALRSVTRRTLNSVFARDRSINFCRLRTLFRSPAFDAVKIRCLSRRTSSSTRRQSTWRQSRGASSSPFTASASAVAASNLSSGSDVSIIFLSTEARFEPRSYGFRPGRGCHDAIQAVYQVVKGRHPKRLWALDADLAQAFDKLAHDHILAMLGTFPARGMIREWLKAGVVEQGRLHRTEDGVPQGGVVSPLLLNVALHGMEQAAGVRYHPTGQGPGRVIVAGCPAAIRYADDFVVLCHSRQEAFEVKARLADWLASRGLSFNEDKTRVVTLDEGFGFLGFNVRRYGTKPLIKPSKAAQRRIRERLRTELRSMRGTNAPTVIKKLNPIIRGWAVYYRTQVSVDVFDALDQYLWELTFKWARFSHANKPTRWVVARYWGR